MGTYYRKQTFDGTKPSEMVREISSEAAWLMAEKNDPLQSQEVYALVHKFAKATVQRKTFRKMFILVSLSLCNKKSLPIILPSCVVYLILSAKLQQTYCAYSGPCFSVFGSRLLLKGLNDFTPTTKNKWLKPFRWFSLHKFYIYLYNIINWPNN